MNKYFSIAVLSSVLVLSGCTQGEDDATAMGNTSQDTASAPKEKKIMYWVAPMDASYRRDEPGKSPMGMDLVPVYEDDAGSGVKISPAVENNLGVRTRTIEEGLLWRRIDTVGYVDFDENKISHIHLRTKGWIEKLYVKSEGERVKTGQLLFKVYSPELVNVQEEYVQALGSGNARLISASQERMQALGVPDSLVTTLKKTRKASQYVPVYAKQNGIVSKLSVREGMFVMPSREVMSLADLSSIWILAEVFESQADWVQIGKSAEVRLSYLPGRLWEGKVEYIYPSLDSKTRTLKVRLRFDNADESLKPNMFTDVTIYGGAKRKTLIIPREALIRAGEEDRVIVSLGEGRFEARKVMAGIESGELIEILSGVNAGEAVVTSGQFLLDSEASLKASMARMSGVGSQDEKMDMSKESTAMAHGSGEVLAVIAGEHKIKLSHEPIEALGWPSMDMFFKVKQDVELENFTPQDKVRFMLKQDKDGYIITSIEKAE